MRGLLKRVAGGRQTRLIHLTRIHAESASLGEGQRTNPQAEQEELQVQSGSGAGWRSALGLPRDSGRDAPMRVEFAIGALESTPNEPA
jgi:hypothetical protein